MGQYYIAVILGPDGKPREFIRCWVNSWDFTNGSKLMEHSYIGNKFVGAVEWLLSPLGPFWKSRLVWAGDYADTETRVSVEGGAAAGADTETSVSVEGGAAAGADAEAGESENLYHIAKSDACAGKREVPPIVDMSEFPYIVNHTKRVYVDKNAVGGEDTGHRIHPLPLLTAEGNGRGGGDFRGDDEKEVGTWARDVLSVEREPPTDYTLVAYEFHE